MEQLLVDLRNAFWGSTCEHLLLPSTLRRSYGVRLILGEKSDISGDIISYCVPCTRTFRVWTLD